MGKSKELNENLKQTILDLDLDLMPMMSVCKILITIVYLADMNKLF